jgi:hypothetical protein
MHPPVDLSRPDWKTPALVGVCLIAGVALGFYLSIRDKTRTPMEPVTLGPRPDPVRTGPPVVHRFPLSSLDAKDTVEAPDVAVDAQGQVFLAWASKTGDAERTVFLVRSPDGGRSFDSPTVVGKGGVFKSVAKGEGKTGYERRATPHVGVEGNEVLVSWSKGEPSGMQMAFAASTDGARTFGPVQKVERGEPATPTFTSMAGGPRGELACCWLSDREGAQLPYVALRRSGAKGFDAQRRVYTGEGQKGVCPCCPTAVAFGPDGSLYVGFRNILQGFRDIAISRLKPGAGTFEGPFPVVPNTWKFDGCPHDGPSLVVIGDTLHVLWMDARSGPQRCYHGWAQVDAMKFEVSELHTGAPGTQGNAKLVADAASGLHAVWEESIGAEPATTHSAGGHQHAAPTAGGAGGRAIAYAYLPNGQTSIGPVSLLAPKPGAFQTRPAIAVLPTGDLVVTWNELDTSGKAVLVTRLPAPAHSSLGVQP